MALNIEEASPSQEAEEIYDVLHHDHEQAAVLFEQISDFDEEDTPRREQLFSELKTALTVHARAEEKVFYAALKRKGLSDEAAEGTEEHAEMSELLEDMSATRCGSDEWKAKFDELRDVVEHHVDEEENEFFPAAREAISNEDALRLGKEMQTEERRLKAAF